MKLHYLQHVPFEGLGSIEDWAKSRGAQVSCTRFFANEMPPPPDEIDLLTVLGGPMGIYDEEEYPWLSTEKEFLKKALATDTKVLGICLGAQLIADALGAKVYPNNFKEIGWLPIEAVGAQGAQWFSQLGLTENKVFHWHGDTFELPDHTLHLARSKACSHQAFLANNRILALQFHLETTLMSAQALIENCGDEIVDSPYIQTPEKILEVPKRFESLNKIMESCLEMLMLKSDLQPVLLGA